MKVRIRCILFAWFLFCPFVISTSFAAQGPTTNQILIKFRAGTTDADTEAVKQRHGLTPIQVLPKTRVHKLRVVPGTNLEQLLRTLQENPAVEYAEPDHEVGSFEARAAIEQKYGRFSVKDRAGVRRMAVSDSKPQPGGARAVADTLLRDTATLLNADPAALKFVDLRQSLSGQHVRYQQTHAGIPIYGASTSVHLNQEGAIRLVQHAAHKGIAVPTQPRLSAAEALTIAVNNVPGSGATATEPPELRLYADQSKWHLVWQLRLQTGTPPGAWELLIDAGDGSVRQRRSRMANLSGSGNVFDPNPTRRAAALGVAAPTHGSDTCPTQYPADATNLTSLMEARNFTGLDASGRLQGPAVKIVNTRYDGLPEVNNPNYATLSSVANSATGQFFFPYNDASGRFEEVMAYYHLQKYRDRLMNDLGYGSTGLLQNVQTIVDVHKVDGLGRPMVGAVTLLPNLIMLGEQHSLTTLRCRELAEEGDALIHEYGGHILYANIHPQAFYDNPGMEEGWADFLMASYFDDPIVGEWSDEISGIGNRRNLQNTLTLLDWQGECGFGVNTAAAHFNGQIWGGILWRIREKLMTQFAVGGISRADVARLMDRLTIEGIYLFPAPAYGQNCDGSQVFQGRDALLNALQLLKTLRPTDPGYDARYAQINSNLVIDEFSAAYIGLRFPNDPNFSDPLNAKYPQTLHNTGTPDGLADADIDAPEAWSLQTGRSDVIVAIVDTGVNFTHEDMGFEDANVNGVLDTGEDRNGNGVLDTGNIWPRLGWDYVDNDNNPSDSNAFFGISHGTMVAGVVGAMGNNGLGASGVNWKVSLIALRTDLAGSKMQGIDFATDNGAQAINGSWGILPWYSRSRTVADAVQRASESNILMVMAAGNTGQSDGTTPLNDDNDKKPLYPQSEVLPNVINVTATGNSDQQRERFGKFTVDLAAPTGALSPSYPPNSYFSIGQTSGAAPHVTGAIALLLAEEKDRIDANPGYRKMTMGEIRYLLLTSVDPLLSLKGKCVSEGRLNAYRLLLSYADSDLDGYADNIEALFGTDARNPASRPDLNADADGDGLSNALELGYGTIPAPLTTGADLRGKIYPIYLDASGRLLAGFTPQDTDGDTVNDLQEITGARSGYVTDPANPDTDGDGIADGTDTAPSLIPALAPTVTATTPSNGAVNVPSNTALSVTFSQVMDSASIKASAFTLMRSFGTDLVPLSVSCNSPCTRASLVPAYPLAFSANYLLTVQGGAPGVKNAQGVPMAALQFASSFTTAAAAPTLTGFWPGAPATRGSMVFVFGSNFIPNTTKVAVNGVDHPSLQVFGTTLLAFVSTSATGPITVTTGAGSATSNSSFGILPTGLQITGIWPGQAKARSVVFVFGSGFDPVPGKTKVSINGLPCPMAHILDPTLLLFFVPASAVSGPVTVGVNSQTVTSGTALTIVP